MAKRMLIDATHPEEIRVVVLDGNRLDEFDFESSTKKQIKGNIYLAKITRVEPSLQAAFVDFGGNRHGFLAFSEIHPDYYRIPVGDRGPYREPGDHPAPETPPLIEGIPGTAAPVHEDHSQPYHGQPAEEAHPSSQAWGAPAEPSDHAEPVQPLAETEAGPSAFGADADVPPPAEAAESAAEQHELDAPAAEHQQLEAPIAASEANDRTLAERSDDDRIAAFHPQDGSQETGAQGEAGRGEAGDGEFGPIDAGGEHGHHHPTSDTGFESSFEGGTHGALDRRSAEGTAIDGMGDAQILDTVGGDEFEEAAHQRSRSLRHYKIQEVVKRRQIMLVQVTKEERGNKGAALTTYLSLAGRYCVLMPNTGRGGGVSRKITSVADRRRLKEILEDLDLPEGMGVIVRTAGSERSKAEIKRDLEYLLRLWDEIRSLTLQSTAPALIYEEGNLIKRSIRDLYARDIDEVLVEGEEGYRTAKAFMKMLMPSHAKRVQPYRDPAIPLFHRFQVETQIDLIHSPVVQLRSGGYIVISPTEALVAIDVNSGRSTKERNIEETATRTNLEAAEEIARQLRLRDLAGLIVIDFIDMEEHRNQAAVERRLKDAMKHDRARIQVGRISPFGLLELSRQRLRPSLVEASTQPCPHCNGTGHIRSTESTALHVLRAIEEEGIRRRSAEICVYVPTAIALYILNQKREALAQIEARYGFHVAIARDDSLIPPAFRLERLRNLTPAEAATIPAAIAHVPPPIEEDEDEEFEETEETTQQAAPASHREESSEEERGRRRRRRRRRRRPGEDHEPSAEQDFARTDTFPTHAAEHLDHDAPAGEIGAAAEDVAATDRDEESAGGRPLEGEASAERKRRRRGKRGGRRRGRGDAPPNVSEEESWADGGTASAEPGEASEAPATESIEIIHEPAMSDGESARRDLDEAFTVAPLEAGEEMIDTAQAPVADAGERVRRPRRPRAGRRSEATEAESVAPAQVEAEPQPAYSPSPEAEAAAPVPLTPETSESALPGTATAGEHEPRPETEPAEAAHASSHGEVAAETVVERESSGSPVPEPKLITEKPANPKRGWWQRLLS